jgi:hypothetical protein
MLKKEDRANQSQRKRGRRNMARTSVVPGFVHTTMRPFAPFAWPVIFATLSLTVLVEGKSAWIFGVPSLHKKTLASLTAHSFWST